MNSMSIGVPEKRGANWRFLAAWFTLLAPGPALLAQEADLIVHHGKVVTVDRDFPCGKRWPLRTA